MSTQLVGSVCFDEQHQEKIKRTGGTGFLGFHRYIHKPKTMTAVAICPSNAQEGIHIAKMSKRILSMQCTAKKGQIQPFFPEFFFRICRELHRKAEKASHGRYTSP
jgi:hypothetical protein